MGIPHRKCQIMNKSEPTSRLRKAIFDKLVKASNARPRINNTIMAIQIKCNSQLNRAQIVMVVLNCRRLETCDLTALPFRDSCKFEHRYELMDVGIVRNLRLLGSPYRRKGCTQPSPSQTPLDESDTHHWDSIDTSEYFWFTEQRD